MMALEGLLACYDEASRMVNVQLRAARASISATRRRNGSVVPRIYFFRIPLRLLFTQISASMPPPTEGSIPRTRTEQTMVDPATQAIPVAGTGIHTRGETRSTASIRAEPAIGSERIAIIPTAPNHPQTLPAR